ncbi:hypothetical protein GCM10022223_43240 [Kineosporia mesophila]|uniref:Uncharacterized protein n=1 Tax=Kineosporia mesophila TaxID=566012 RepID=A0ABP6ZX86_9ACTN
MIVDTAGRVGSSEVNGASAPQLHTGQRHILHRINVAGSAETSVGSNTMEISLVGEMPYDPIMRSVDLRAAITDTDESRIRGA